MLNNLERKYTIIIPIYRGMPTAKQAILSVIRQKYKNFSLIIIDNGGCEKLKEFIYELGDDRINLVSYPNAVSIEENWQRLHEINITEYMTVIGHDDELEESFLSNIDTLINQYPECVLYGTLGVFVDENRNLLSTIRHFKGCFKILDYIGARFRGTIDVSGTGFVYRSEDFRSLGGFPKFPNLCFADDAFWIKLLNTGSGIISDEIGYKVMLHSKSMSFAKPSIGMNLSSALADFNQFYEREISDDIKRLWVKEKRRFMKRYLLQATILVSLDDLSRSAGSLQIREVYKRCRQVINRTDFMFYLKLSFVNCIIKIGGRLFSEKQIMSFIRYIRNAIK